MMKRFTILVIAALGTFGATRVEAQSVSDVLTFLLNNESVQTGSVERDRQAALATTTTISRALLTNLATIPVPSSSSAFVYRLNPELGTVERLSQNFGPFFVERALTAGAGEVSFGLAAQAFRFTSLDGRPLRDGTLVTTANQFVDEAAPFDVDRLTLDINANVATFYGNIGVSDRVEVGFALPFLSLDLSGSRLNTYRGRTFAQASAQAHAAGLADVVVRTKILAYHEEGGAIAAAVDVRLPTGRSEDLLGAGTTAVKFSGIGSLEGSRWSGHANVGFTAGGPARELSLAGAVAAAATGHVTITGELLGRLIDARGIGAVSEAHPTVQNVETIRLLPEGGRLTEVSLVAGFKWNLSDTWVLAGNVTIPVTHDGLTSPFAPFIGLDYSLGR
jgi:hypothetical protein